MSRTDVLVTADWAQENLGAPGIVFVEVDEDTSAYDGGHLEGAVKLDWKTDLQDSSASNASRPTKSRDSGSCRSVFQSSLTAPSMWPLS